VTTNRFVGSGLARVSAAALGILTVGLAAAGESVPRFRSLLLLVAGLLTWIAFVHSSKALFRRWMRFAEALHQVAVTTIFGVCYLVIVPIFRAVLWFRDPLHLRRPPQESSWVARTATVDANSMERMG
jgi:hypothetical protein